MLRWNCRAPLRGGREGELPSPRYSSERCPRPADNTGYFCLPSNLRETAWKNSVYIGLNKNCPCARTASLITMQTERPRTERRDLHLRPAQRASPRGGPGRTDGVTGPQKPWGSHEMTALCLPASAEVCDTVNWQYSFSPVPMQLDAPRLTSRKWTSSNASWLTKHYTLFIL